MMSRLQKVRDPAGPKPRITSATRGTSLHVRASNRENFGRQADTRRVVSSPFSSARFPASLFSFHPLGTLLRDFLLNTVNFADPVLESCGLISKVTRGLESDSSQTCATPERSSRAPRTRLCPSVSMGILASGRSSIALRSSAGGAVRKPSGRWPV